MSAIPPKDAAYLFVKAITANSPAGHLIETRYGVNDGPPRRQDFTSCRAQRAIARQALARGQLGHVYLGAAPRTRRKGTAAAIENSNVLWVDLDVTDALERLDAFRPRPTIITLTGTQGHAQAVWALNGPVGTPQVAQKNRQLAHALGGDPAAVDPARVLRCPGTLNFKHDPPVLAVCVHLKLDSYHVEQIVGHLPDPPGPRPASPGPGISSPARGGADPLLAIPAADYVSALTGRQVDREGKARCPWHSGGQERTASFHTYGDGTWACFGSCEPLRPDRQHRGGDIYVFAGLLWGLDWRDGAQFKALRRRLAGELLPLVREAAA